MPLDWLLVKEDPSKLPPGVYTTDKQRQTANNEHAWSRKREQVLAAAAAGVHLGLFAWNLAFWGFEGVPPNRYHPTDLRWVLVAHVPCRWVEVRVGC